jgi:hypothetical protein
LVQNGPEKSGRGQQANADESRQNAEEATGSARQYKKEEQALNLAGLPGTLASTEDRAAFARSDFRDRVSVRSAGLT